MQNDTSNIKISKISTVNFAEIQKFDAIGGQWWDENSAEFKILHTINPYRIAYIIQHIQDYLSIQNHKSDIATSQDKSKELPCSYVQNQLKWWDWLTIEQKSSTLHNTPAAKNMRILDIGCGGGLISIPLAQHMKISSITSLDASPQAIKALQTRISALDINNIQTVCSNIETFYAQHQTQKSGIPTSPSPQQYDMILAIEIIEHVDNVRDFLHYAWKLLKPQGILVISSINRTIKSYLSAIIAAEYILKWVPKNTHNWNKFIKPSEIIRIIQDMTNELNNAANTKFQNLRHTPQIPSINNQAFNIVDLASLDYSILNNEWKIISSKFAQQNSLNWNVDSNFFLTIRKI